MILCTVMASLLWGVGGGTFPPVGRWGVVLSLLWGVEVVLSFLWGVGVGVVLSLLYAWVYSCNTHNVNLCVI